MKVVNKMKKHKILLLFVFGIAALFIGLKNVHAEDLTMYIECTYNNSYGTIKGTDPLYVMYTELLDESGNRYQVKSKKTATGTIENIADMTGYFGFSVEKSDESNTTFITAMKNNNGKCPKYMTAEYKDNTLATKNYKVLFYNDLSSSSDCSGTPGSKCKAYFENVSTVNNVVINTDEDDWSLTTPTDIDDICSDINVTLSIKDKQLYGLPLYGRNTKYVQGVNWTAAKPVAHLWFVDIADLALNNKFSKMLFDPQTTNDLSRTTNLATETFGDYQFWTSSETVCNWPSGASFTKGKSCAAVNDSNVQSVLNKYETQITNLFPNITSIYESLTYPSYVSSSTGYVPRQPLVYESEGDLQKLKDAVKNAGLVQAEDTEAVKTLENNLNSIKDGTHPDLAGVKPCQNTITKVDQLLQRLGNFSKGYGTRVEAINTAAENARKRAEEVGATTEDLNEMDKVITNLQEIVERNYAFSENINNNLLSDVDVNLSGISSSGCGVISNDMKRFLNTVLWYIRIAGIVLAIVLSLLDYVKAAAGSDDKSMAAANKKFMTRVILVAVLFLIPVILEFLLNALNISTTAGSISCLD